VLAHLLARLLGKARAVVQLDALSARDQRRHRRARLGDAWNIGGLFRRRHRELELVAAIEVDRDRGCLREALHGQRECADQRADLLVLGELEAQSMELEKTSRERGRPFVKIGPLDRHRGLVADRREQLEVTLVVRRRLRALDRDRADRAALESQWRDHEGALDERPPRAPLGEPKALAVAFRVPQQDRAVALDADARERPCDGHLRRLHLLAVLAEVAEREHATIAVRARDVERIDVERPAHLGEDLAEHGHRIQRHPDGVADLNERGEEPRTAFRREARTDVEIAHHEQWDARDEEPWLDEDDLQEDDGRQAPEQLRAHRPGDPLERRAVERDVPERALEEHDLAKVEADEREDRDDARDDRRRCRIGERRGCRENEPVDDRGRPGRDRGGGGVAEDLDRSLAREQVREEPPTCGQQGDGARRQEHDAGQDGDVRG